MTKRPIPSFKTWLARVPVTPVNRDLLKFLGTVGGNQKMVLYGIRAGDCLGAPDHVVKAAERLHRRFFEAGGRPLQYDDFYKRLMKNYPYISK